MSSKLSGLRIARMTQEEADAVADWHYDAPYDFYDPSADEEALATLLDGDRRADRIFSARGPDGDLVGYFTFTPEGDVVVVGIGLRPDLTNQGFGLSFLEKGLAFGKKRFGPQRFRVSVAQFNRRAIKVSEQAGFVRTRELVRETNGGVFAFVELERPS